MAKVGSWSTTPASNNSAPPDGWPEGQAPSTVNDCARQMMADIRTLLNDLSFVDLALTPTRTGNTTFTVTGNQTAFLDIGRRVKCFDASTLYGTVISSSFTTNTGITLRLDSGVLTASLSSMAVSVLSNQNQAIPESVYKKENLILNPYLELWSRGNGPFGISGSAQAVYTADMYRVTLNAGASINVSRSERSANASNVPTLAQAGMMLNSSLCISVSAADASIAGSDYCAIQLFIEGFDYRNIAQRPLTFGFWVNTNRTGTYCISVRNGGFDRVFISEYSVSAASTWEEKTFAIPEPPSAGTWDYSFGIGLNLNLTLAAGATFQGGAGNWTTGAAVATSNQQNFMASAGHTMRVTGFYLYDGVTKLPMQIAPYSDQLARIQRYVMRIDGSATRIIGSGVVANGSVTDLVTVKMARTMRVPPSISSLTAGSLYINDGATNLQVTNFNTDYSSNDFWSRQCLGAGGGGLVAGRAGMLVVSAGAVILFKSEF